MKFLEAVANIFKVADLRKRLLFTLALLAVYRLGSRIPIPGIDANRFADFVSQNQGGFLGYLDLFSGGSFRRLTIFALGIMPYITASIILQLLTVVVPTLEKLQKEGEIGRRKITQWTRYLTVGLAMMQSFGIAVGLSQQLAGIRHESGRRLHLHGHRESHDRYGVHHVAGRADHRARHRQRHVADHLHRHRGGAAPRHQRNRQQDPDRRLERVSFDHHSGDDGGGGRIHRAGGTRRAAHPGAVRQARDRHGA